MNNRRAQIVAVVLIALAVLAVALYFWPASQPARKAAKAAAPAATNTVSATSRDSTNRVPDQPLVPIDRRYLQDRWQAWLADATRDPFQLASPPVQKVAKTTSPARHLKLAATWLQTDSRLAVIEQQVLGVGDEIQGFTVLRIEAGEVHLQGPDKTEVINFASYVPPPPPGQRQALTNLIDNLLGPEREPLHN